MKILQFLRDWALIVSMLSGILGYLIYVSIPELYPLAPIANQAVAILQPSLIFLMLFFTFCKINPLHLRFCRWHLWLLLIQGGSFIIIALALMLIPNSDLSVILQGAMLCLICPTATAAPVITRKLGGDIALITTYTVLINLLVAILVPLLVPCFYPQPGLTTGEAILLIMGKVFPLLLLPMIFAVLVRYLLPPLHRLMIKWQDAPFYLWVISLALAMVVTTRSICHSDVNLMTELWLVAVSLIACIGQFYMGWRIGSRYGDRITAGQAFGQKNTVLAIWLGYTFFNPITSIVGGFYSIWHNVINSYQLYKHKKGHQPNQKGVSDV